MRKQLKHFKEIYKEKVLPNKARIKNTQETYEEDIRCIEEYSIYRLRSNEKLLGGYGDE